MCLKKREYYLRVRYNFMVSIPLINEQGEPDGHMYKFLSRQPKYLPRIGEQVYVLPELYLKVEQVFYSGLSLYAVRLELSPLSSEHRVELETSLGNRKNSSWRWSES